MVNGPAALVRLTFTREEVDLLLHTLRVWQILHKPTGTSHVADSIQERLESASEYVAVYELAQ